MRECVWCKEVATHGITNRSHAEAGGFAPSCEVCLGVFHQVMQMAMQDGALFIFTLDQEAMPEGSEKEAVLEAMEIFKDQWSAMERAVGGDVTPSEPLGFDLTSVQPDDVGPLLF